MTPQKTLHDFINFLIANSLLTTINSQQLLLALKKDQTALIPYITNHALLNSGTLATAIAQYFNLKFIDLVQYEKKDFALEILNNKLIAKYRVLPLNNSSKHIQTLTLATYDPFNVLALNAIKFHTAREIELVVAEYDKLEHWIEILLAPTQIITTPQTSQINASEKNNKQKNDHQKTTLFSADSYQAYQNHKPANSSAKSDHSTQDNAIINLADKILARAVAQHASDIHFEPYSASYRVRLRIDGILYPEEAIDINLAQALSSRLKVMANLDIAERRLPQDGRFTLQLEEKKFDCRISTCPTIAGEKIVVRILNPVTMNLDITHTGLTATQQQIFLTHINAPQGMVIVTGPTGSGKTVTLYTALALLNTSDQNISTVEDPIEINLSGINQVEVNPKIGLTFAAVLRTFLRQDPDIIMLGEIRDQDTAQIAIKAAQTGHLVLSTLHTNSAAATITRLLNMDVAAFNLVGALKLLIAQRLVRKLCEHCKEKRPIPAALLAEQHLLQNINKDAEENIANHDQYIFTAHHAGCSNCKNGYLGRSGIFELLPISPIISSMILERRSTLEIEHQASLEGMVTLRVMAWQKVLAGETSLEEINRVVL